MLMMIVNTSIEKDKNNILPITYMYRVSYILQLLHIREKEKKVTLLVVIVSMTQLSYVRVGVNSYARRKILRISLLFLHFSCHRTNVRLKLIDLERSKL